MYFLAAARAVLVLSFTCCECRYLAARMNEDLSKPVSLRRLVELIEEQLRGLLGDSKHTD